MNELTTMNNSVAIPNKPTNEAVLAQISVSREVTEAQAAIMVSKRFPRNEMEVLDKILLACQRPALAETALYSYSKGGTAISGASIRLAETIFRLWGNGLSGLRQLEDNTDESVIEAYAIDYETNVRQSKIFIVKHERSTKKGNYAITDPREKYENLANFGARRLRACLLSLIPADILEAAVEQCEETLKAKADTSPAALQKVVEAFGKFSVTKEQIELRIQRRFDTITPAQLVQLRKVYNSLKDGMSAPSDWFQQDPATVPATLADKLKAKLPQPVIEQQPDHIRDATEKVDEPVQTTFRDEYIDLKKAGYSTFIFQNLDRLKNCSGTLHAEAVAKWNKLYPDQICPFLNKKDDPTDTSIDSTHTDQPKQKAPIVCKKDEQHRGVFPEDCTACGKLDGCDQYSEYIFDLEHQNQHGSSDSSGF